MPAGRPTKYSHDEAVKICDRLAIGDSVASLGREEGFPSERSIYEWLSKYPEFAQIYARAREFGLERMANDLLEISDEEPTMTVDIVSGTGSSVSKICLDPTGIQRNRLRVDTRKWVMAKLAPKKYGDKLTLDGELNVSLASRLKEARENAERARK